MIETLFYLVVVILVVGFCCFLIKKAPIDENFKSIAIAVLVFFLILCMLFFVASMLGVGPGIGSWPTTRLR